MQAQSGCIAAQTWHSNARFAVVWDNLRHTVSDPEAFDEARYAPADDLAEELHIKRRHLDRIARDRGIDGIKRRGDRRTWFPRQPFADVLAEPGRGNGRGSHGKAARRDGLGRFTTHVSPAEPAPDDASSDGNQPSEDAR